MEELIYIIVNSVITVISAIIAFVKNKKTKTSEEIEAIAEKKKQKLITKLNKKNGIKTQISDVVKEMSKPDEIVIPSSIEKLTQFSEIIGGNNNA